MSQNHHLTQTLLTLYLIVMLVVRGGKLQRSVLRISVPFISLIQEGNWNFRRCSLLFPAVYKRSDGSVYEPPPGISTFTVRDSIHILAGIQATRSYHFQKDGNDRIIKPKMLLVGTHSDLC